MMHLKNRKKVRGARAEEERKKVVPNKVDGGDIVVMSLTFFIYMQ